MNQFLVGGCDGKLVESEPINDPCRFVLATRMPMHLVGTCQQSAPGTRHGPEICWSVAGVQGRTITLKLKRRKENAPEPPKFMGHGICDNMSRSVTVARFTASQEDVANEARQMLQALHVDPTQIRGIGLNVRPLSAVMPDLSACLPTFGIFSGDERCAVALVYSPLSHRHPQQQSGVGPTALSLSRP